LEDKGAYVKFKHEISIYIGDANLHDFNSLTVPPIYSLLDKCLNALHGKSLVKGCGNLNVVNDGEFLLTTDCSQSMTKDIFNMK